ncbi:MAG: MFS transporter [Oscillospiraceae bacterium]|jgi:Na+/melibiose symporter-like transporter|nr:MFS transporter [Oscillospiraceae bacterium]
MEKVLKTPVRMRLGWFIAQTLFSAVTCIEIFYYTGFLVDVALIPLVLVGVIKTTTAILDFASSIVLPIIMQKLKLPWGKYRSYFVLLPAIYCIFGALAISKVIAGNDPAGMTINTIVIVVSYFISRFLWNLTDAASSTFTSVAARQYPDAQVTLSMWRGRGSASSSLWFGAIAGPMIALFIKATGSNTWGYTLMALVFFLINIVGYRVLFWSTKPLKQIDMEELNVENTAENKIKLVDIFKAVGTNTPLLILWIYDVFRQLAMFYGSGVMFFYFAHSLKADWAISTSVLVGGIGGFLSGFIAAPIVAKLGTKRSLLLSMFGGAVVGIIMYILNLKDPWAVMLIRAITGLLLGSSMVLITKTYADCSIYAEYKTGKDMRATVMASFPIPIKIMSVFIGLVTTAAIAYTGYNAEKVQAGEMIIDELMIRRFDQIFFVVPAIFSAIAGILMLFYPSDKKFQEWGNEVNKRKGITSTAAQ